MSNETDKVFGTQMSDEQIEKVNAPAVAPPVVPVVQTVPVPTPAADLQYKERYEHPDREGQHEPSAATTTPEKTPPPEPNPAVVLPVLPAVQTTPVPTPQPIAPYRERYIHPERSTHTEPAVKPAKPFNAPSPLVGHGGEAAQRDVRENANVSERTLNGRPVVGQ